MLVSPPENLTEFLNGHVTITCKTKISKSEDARVWSSAKPETL